MPNKVDKGLQPQLLDYPPTLRNTLNRGGIYRGDRTLKEALFGAIARSLNRALETELGFKDARDPKEIERNVDRCGCAAPGY
jgi:hypothetical protein